MFSSFYPTTIKGIFSVVFGKIYTRWCGFAMKRFFKFFIMFSGAFIFAVGFNIFLKPAGVTPGGLSGLALLVNFLIPQIPVGFFTLVLNLPLFLLGMKKLGGEFTVNTIVTTIALSIFLDLPLNFLNFQFEPLLAAIFGGVLIGAGIGITFLQNSSTGGLDIAVRVLCKKFPQFSLGQIMLVFDAVIALSAGIVFGNISNSLYAVITMYVASITLDAILYGLNYAKAALIITDHSDKINASIQRTLSRGTTLIPCFGGFSKNEKTLLLCAVKRNELSALKRAVAQADENAFMILTEAHEVAGFGFRSRI